MLFLSSEKNLSLTFKGEISHKQIGSINLTEPTDYKDFNKVIEKFEQSAKSNPTQGRARDIARQNHITQLLSAIVAYQSMNGKRPGLDTKRPQSTSVLNEYLIDQGILSKLPTDPDKNSIVF
ncbi:MAG: hypothetical protein LBO09_08945 [Candidatus Peribacteria bacterium]|jgi:hypothetical protein|nr:hypothetical protein [Candidatus Peribacteria bacterium]